MKSVNVDPRLLAAIDSALTEHGGSMGEFELMTYLDKHHPELYPKPDMADKLLMFQHHFYLQHCLYHLQQRLAEEGTWWLDITSVRITKYLSSQQPSNALAQNTSLRDYYLDLSNMNKESQQSVQDLIDGFWKGLAKYLHQPAALETLGLTGHESEADQKAKYRALAQQHHPDKGGDAEQFQEIQNAWQSLKRAKK